MTAIELLTDLRRQGFTLIPLSEGKLAVKPADRLTDDLRQHIRQRKSEVVTLLAAMTWLRSRLATPQHIALLVAEWVSERDGANGSAIDDLMNAR